MMDLFNQYIRETFVTRNPERTVTMNMMQVALAVFNDQSTEAARSKALDHFTNGAEWDGAVQTLLPVVFAELKKPIYEGITFDDTAWTAAAHVLDMQVQHAIDCKGV